MSSAFLHTQFILSVGCLSVEALDEYMFQKEIMKVIEEVG